MKLHEILDTSIKYRGVPDYQENGENANNRYWNNKEKDPNAGYFSKVEPKKNDPFMVRKTNFDPVKDLEQRDGYFHYINELKKSKLAEQNPYFPRVYDVKVYKDSQGKARYKADIEKLIHASELSSEELMHVGKKMFNDFDRGLTRMSGDTDNSIVQALSVGKEKILHTINMLLDDSFYSLSYIKDPTLEEAVAFLKKLHKQNPKIEFDLKSDNFMFRRGRNGPQLVITDPFMNSEQR